MPSAAWLPLWEPPVPQELTSRALYRPHSTRSPPRNWVSSEVAPASTRARSWVSNHSMSTRYSVWPFLSLYLPPLFDGTASDSCRMTAGADSFTCHFLVPFDSADQNWVRM